jgi:hypothetical protein
MAAFNKFNVFVQDLAYGNHVLKTAGGNTLKVCLVNTLPTASLTGYSGLSGEPANANGYVTGGQVVTVSGSSQTSGTYKLTITDAAWTASGGSIGPFQYAVLYNDTAVGKPLIGWWDYGSSISLASGETFTVDYDAGNGVLTLV